jgi:16S rRNA (adenine1518-N6/adenine1519-N6)-dimethyltransferase
LRALLGEHGLGADKALGQHFLADPGILERIAAAAGAGPGDTVLEIGPGPGTLTAALLRRGARVVAIERDRRFEEVLAVTCRGLGELEVIWGDALEVDWPVPGGSRFASNLPYNVGTALLLRALEEKRFARVVALLQREVVDRALARPGTPAYGLLSVLVAAHATGRRVLEVGAGAFSPPPRVRSAVIALDPHPAPVVAAGVLELARIGFRERRKTLLNNLRRAGVPADHARGALREAGLEERVRMESLGLTELERLGQALGPLAPGAGREPPDSGPGRAER